MSYTNYKWEAAANDYNSPYFRNRIWTRSFFRYPRLLGISRPVLGIASREDQIEYIADLSTWMSAHEELKKKILADYREFKSLIDKSVSWGEAMNRWTQSNIFNANLKQKTGEEIMSLLYQFIEMQEQEYTYGTALPILDFVGFSFVDRNLVDFLNKTVPPDAFHECYATFTEPEHDSFAQEQEKDLLKLMADHSSLRGDLEAKSLGELRISHPDFYSDLIRHARKHGWVYYVYAGPAFSEKEFLGFIKDYYRKGVDPALRLQELAQGREETKRKQRQYLKELKPGAFDEFILKIAGRVMWAKPRRKDYQTRSYFHIERLLNEIAERLAVSLGRVRSMPYEMLGRALAGETIDWSLADSIYECHVCVPTADEAVLTLTGTEATDFISKVLTSKPEKSKLQTELKGTIARKGLASGEVKIINVPADMDKMAYGDILVSTATTPSIVPAMKKAAAIVTDEGGLTCHAAIVSRELGIPCVVGAKIATKILRDGEPVTVDADKGIITILKRRDGK